MLSKRFTQKVEITPTCWNWKACITKDGYGYFRTENGMSFAHRVAYEHHHGIKIKSGLEIDHLCRNRKCVNPAHLEVVTKYENWIRGFSFSKINKMKTHCLRGHPLSGDNLGVGNKRPRVCKACDRLRHRHKKVAA